VLANLEAAVADLPAVALTVTDAAKRVKQHPDHKALLKKAKDALIHALTVPDSGADPVTDAKGNPPPDKPSPPSR
jgi:hypothetical protein